MCPLLRCHVDVSVKRFWLTGPVLLGVFQTACIPLGKLTVTRLPSPQTSPVQLVSALTFGGITSISAITGTSLTLHWTGVAGAASYAIYNTTAGNPVFVGAVVAPATSYTVTGLHLSTPYQFSVTLLDTAGLPAPGLITAPVSTASTNVIPGISYSSPSASYTLGSPITTNTSLATGGTPSAFSVSPALPAGLILNPTSGQISGTPTTLVNGATHTVSAMISGASVTTALNLAVNFAGLTSISGVTGNSLTLNWSLPPGANPGPGNFSIYQTNSNIGLIQTVNRTSTSATITGLNPGTSYAFTVRMVDTAGTADENSVSLSATTVSTAPPSNLSYTTANPTYVLGSAVTPNTPSSSGGAVASYSISPPLPAGLSFNASSGQITGTPTRLVNLTTYTVTASNAGGSTTATLNLAVNFAGITGISAVSGTSLQLNWNLPSGANPGPANFLIYSGATIPYTYLATAAASSSSYSVTGLSQNIPYQFLVRMTDTSGIIDSNTVAGATTTSSVTATFQGWSNVVALGSSIPALQAPDLSTVAANITLTWNPVTVNSGSVASYNIYRGTSPGGESATPLATGISASALTYTDSTVTPNTTHFYTIAPVVGGSATFPTLGADNEIAVIVPPNNMALIHPWIANLETCGLMGRTIDRTNNYRCMYVGPGNVSGYLNNLAPYFVDTYGVGCNYSASPACGGAACIGTSGAPADSLGSNGNVYYDRNNGSCYYNVSGTWIQANSFSGTNFAAAASNAPGLPPLVNIDQNHSWTACQALTVAGYTHAKRLMRHREHIAAAAWSPSLSDSAITNLENGTNLYSTFACNSNNGSGLNFTTSTIPSDLNTLPGEGNNANNMSSVRTGSMELTRYFGLGFYKIRLSNSFGLM